MIPRKLKVLFIAITLFFSTASLFAVEEYVSKIYKNIDLIFVAKSGTDLNKILSENIQDRYYYLIENYTEKKIRRLIINNDYDFAMEAIVIVIENNLDNEQAVEMYAVISEAYEAQQAYEAQEELKRQQELARIEAEKEKKRASVDKEYIAASKSQGGSVYVAGKETKLTSYHWKAMLALGDISFMADSAAGLKNFHYGNALDIRYEYIMPKIIIGADLLASWNYLPFTDEDNKDYVSMFGDIEAFPKVALPVAKNVFLRAGFAGLIAGKADDASDNVQLKVLDTLYSPAIGIKIEKLKIGSSELDFGIDWYLGSLYTSNLNFAMGGYLNMALPYAELEKVKLTFNLGLRDKLFLKSSGIENRANVVLSIGVENVSK
ncbi:MAG: hypothetical protein IJ688_07920 [Treponema sp.]|nr:hypothetical protein [Treponema sp.]